MIARHYSDTFYLNPGYHYVHAIREPGVAGAVRDVSIEGLGIDARIDLLDTCQMFSEAMEQRPPFELEVVVSSLREERLLVLTIFWGASSR